MRGGWSGGPGRGPFPPPRPPRPPRRYWGDRRGGGYRRGGSCFSYIAVVILIIAVLLITSFQSKEGIFGGKEPKVTQSPTQREAITGTKTFKDWYLDETHYIDRTKDLTDGLKYFYSKTGIQPYVLFLDYDGTFWNGDIWNEEAAEQYLAQVYKDTFADNGHMILAYFACENDSQDLDGTFYLYYGSAAYSIMDNEAETIFWSYFDGNYDNLDYSIGEFIGKSFEQTADNIMHVEKDNTIRNILLISLGAVFIVFILAVVITKKVISKDSEKLV